MESRESGKSKIFDRIAQKTMDRKEKVKYMFNLGDGVTYDSAKKLEGFRNQEFETNRNMKPAPHTKLGAQ